MGGVHLLSTVFCICTISSSFWGGTIVDNRIEFFSLTLRIVPTFSTHCTTENCSTLTDLSKDVSILIVNDHVISPINGSGLL